MPLTTEERTELNHLLNELAAVNRDLVDLKIEVAKKERLVSRKEDDIRKLFESIER